MAEFRYVAFRVEAEVCSGAFHEDPILRPFSIRVQSFVFLPSLTCFDIIAIRAHVEMLVNGFFATLCLGIKKPFVIPVLICDSSVPVSYVDASVVTPANLFPA